MLLVLSHQLEYFFSVYYSLRFSSSPVGWLRFNNKCFMFKGKKNDIKGNWSYARSWCREQGGDLAVIDDQRLFTFPFSPTDFVANLLVENQYAWSDGVSPVLYTNWNDKEPNNANGVVRTLCFRLSLIDMHASRMFHGTWNDTKCDLEKPYICKKTSGTNSIRIELFFLSF
uniref:C-type lectin domain-containing protein n=1 Tax=Astatotilapia calliptera TaxID=8154 RepID=A0A3P8NII6_ASTCA